ncbi:MAG TPA: hypothetical protein VK716_11275 [Terracidiphilus sp.]|nr:hypothetical protein [Terracidiphilus sp.]
MSATPLVQNRSSIVTDTLQSLTEQARVWRAKIDLLEAGQKLDRAEALADLNQLLDVCQNLRDAILSEDSAASWRTKDELHSLVGRLDEAAAKRQRYLDLAQVLSNGTVVHRRERTKQERLRQRDAAVTELMEISAQAVPTDLPGPAATGWLQWACSLDDSSNDPDLAILKASFPRVDDFVRQLEIDCWQDGAPPTGKRENDAIASVTRGPEAVPPISLVSEPEPEPEGGSALSAAPAAAEKPKAESDSRSFLESFASSVATETLPAVVADAAPAANAVSKTASAVAEPVAVVTPAPKVTKEAKLCFFEADEVLDFSRLLEDAKRNPRKSRKVRALLAVSHWLVPRDQNPVLHPKYGIRAQLDYKAANELNPVSPSEALREIERAESLPLLAGGADLLRWSLDQHTEKRQDEVATIRRWTSEQLRSWFADVYKIELAEPQVQDMFALTHGIPLLVGELHRRVIPMHDAPPTWLGFAIWTRIKASFDGHMTTLAMELRNGPPAVKLTDREIELLKMIVIASEDSTQATIAENLSTNWTNYKRPEFGAVSDADEKSIAVLQGLGLVPMRREFGMLPLHAILPVEKDDPIRQIAQSL